MNLKGGANDEEIIADCRREGYEIIGIAESRWCEFPPRRRYLGNEDPRRPEERETRKKGGEGGNLFLPTR